MPADLIVYALVAAGLVFWLRSVLGTRHGEERERSNAFLASDGNERSDDVIDISIDGPPAALSMPERISALANEPRDNCSIDSKTAENGLIDIAKADKSFDIDFFLDGAQDAFVMIVESFAEGDRDMLKDLLADDVYKAFEAAIDEREKLGHVQITDIHAIRKVDVIDAKLEDGRQAVITLRIVAEESSVTKDEAGEVVSGHADKTHEMQDIWVLGRDIKSKDPSWLLMETRGGFEEDNELIPDSH